MPTTIKIEVQGLQERINGINNIINGLDQVKLEIHRQAAEFMANEMRRNVHVITGQLKSSITTTATTESGTVEVLAPYAVYENRRTGGTQGPHDFADRAEQATITALPQMVDDAISRLISSY